MVVRILDVVDSAPAMRFVACLRHLIENPGSLG